MRAKRSVFALTAVGALAASFGLATGGRASGSADVDLKVFRGLVYRVVEGQTLRLDAYLPVSPQSVRAVVVVVHGGGWRSGTRAAFAPGEASVEPTARLFAARGWATFSIDYRLAPESRFPAQLSDVQSAIAWVRRHHLRYRIDPRRVALLGASAGGNLAVLAALTAAPGARPVAAVSWSGPMDLTTFYDGLSKGASRPFVADYLGCTPAACPARYREASPLDHVTAASPPILLTNGSSEIVPLEQAREMAAALQAKRVPHTLIVVAGSRHAADYEAAVIDRTISFLANRFSRR